MKCLSCDYPDSHVVSSEKNEIRNFIKRRRECIRCGVRFTTTENYRENQNDINQSYDKAAKAARR